ncbi:MAG TPA: hypothetical protein DIW61_02755 [Candidatus Aminicenantes bacterium]|jgi:hypothetical protein|nr:hypothetical protein [Candidatus Aminicenantes bacterium]
MGSLRDEKQVSRTAQEFFTETVEKLWKSTRFLKRKFGDLLRIWHFAQNFVKRPAAAEKCFYFIYIQSIRSSSRSALSGFAREK